MSFFSVIITVYNKAECIKDTINSVLNQSYKDFEIIIINDGSTDKSEDIIKTFNDQRINLITTKNQGASKARNIGIEKATATYIALLDGDDTWEIDYLKHIHNAISKFPDIKIFTTGISHKYDNKTVPVSYSFKQKELYKIRDFFQSSLDFHLITNSSVVFDKSIISKTGLFDPSIISGQDTDLWIRFGLHFKILFINKQLVYYNFDPTSLSNTTFNLSKKPKFDNYFNEEKNNIYLKVFLDNNRYAMSILSKLLNDKKHFLYYTSHINPKNLNFKQHFLLKSPKWLLKLLLKVKSLKGEKVYYPNT